MNLAAERRRGSSCQFTGLTIDWDSLEQLYADVGLPPRLPTQAWRMSVPIYERGGHRQVGYATSRGLMPAPQRYIAPSHPPTSPTAPCPHKRNEGTLPHRR